MTGLLILVQDIAVMIYSYITEILLIQVWGLILLLNFIRVA